MTEIDTVGFRILRESPGGREKRLDVVAPMIPAAGHGMAGASYEIFDGVRQSVADLQYYIEDIDIYGKVTRHGPIAVDRGVRETRQRGL